MDAQVFLNNTDEKIFAMFAGRSGSGKTKAAADLPRPFLEIDCDLRANGLINAMRQGLTSPEAVEIIQIKPTDGYMGLQNLLNSLYNQVASGMFKFKSIDIGSSTSMIRLLNISSLTAGKSAGIGHMQLQGLALTGPADFKFESQATHKVFDFLRILPCNLTVSAHIVDRYGKGPLAKEGDPQVCIGEKLTCGTANLAENVLAEFNDVYRFEKRIIDNLDRYFVNFNTDFAKNSFGIPPGEFDITNKNFWEFFQNLVKSIKNKTFVKPTPAKVSGGF